LNTWVNKLSEYQLCQIREVTGLSGEQLNIFKENIEFQLEQEGKIPTNEHGDIDYQNLDGNIFKECRDLLNQIRSQSEKLATKIAMYNQKATVNLDVDSSNLGFKECNDFEKDGYWEYKYIDSVSFLEKLALVIDERQNYYQPRVKGSSSRLTESLYRAWCFGLPHKLPNGKTTEIKISDSNAFINITSIVTSWSIDTTKQNVKNAQWFKSIQSNKKR
jgi:hypothetical protein